MKELSLREKNLGVVVVVVCALGLWWYLARNLHRRTAALEAEVLTTNERIRQGNATLASLRSATPGDARAPAAAIVHGKVSMALLKDLTVPAESAAVSVVAVSRADNGQYTMTVEGKFGEMMRFLSYLERRESRFSVGNIQFGRAQSETDGRRIRANLTLAMKG